MKSAGKFEDQLNQQMNANDVLEDIGYRTDTIHDDGNTIRCFCPIHNESLFRSLTITLGRNTIKCGFTHCPGFNGGDLLDLYSKTKNISRLDAVIFWATKLGIDLEDINVETPVEEETQPAETTEKPIAKINPTKAKPIEKKKVSGTAIDTGTLEKLVAGGKYQESLPLLESALKIQPDNPKLHELTGKALLGMGQKKEALESLKKAITGYQVLKENLLLMDLYQMMAKHDPNNPAWYELQVPLLIANNKAADAAIMMKKAGELYLTIKGQEGRGIQFLEKVHKSKTRDIEVRLLLIRGYCLHNQMEQAGQLSVDTVELLLSEKKTKDALLLLKDVTTALPDSLILRQKYVQLIEADNGDKDLLKNQYPALAQLQTKSEDYEGALQTLEKLTKINPEDHQIQSKLEELYIKTGKSAELLPLYKEIALEALNEKDTDKAAEYWKKILGLEPDNEEILQSYTDYLIKTDRKEEAEQNLLHLAQRYQSRKDYSSAYKFLNTIIELNPDSLQAHEGLLEFYRHNSRWEQFVFHLLRLATLYQQQKRWDEALKLVKEGLKYNQRRMTLLQLQGELYQQIGQKNRALGCYSRLAYEQVKQNNFEDAQKTYAYILKLDKTQTSIITRIGNLMAAAGKPADAINQWTTASALYLKKNSPAMAVPVLEKAYQLDNKNIKILEALALACSQTKDAAKTEKYYTQTGIFYAGSGQMAKAVSCFNKALEASPGSPDPLLHMAQVYQKTDKIPQAIQCYAELAEAFLKKKKLKEAATVYQTILKLDPEQTDIYEKMGTIFHKIGNQDEGVKCFLAGGRKLIQKKDYVAATAMFRKMSSLYPDQLEGLHLLAELYRIQKMPQEAMKIYKLLLSHLDNTGKTKEIVGVLQNMVRLDSQDMTLRIKLVQQYEKENDISNTLMEYDVIAGLLIAKKNTKETKKILQRMRDLAKEDTVILQSIDKLESKIK